MASDLVTGDPDAPGVLVLHPWWGRTSWIVRFCDELAGEGFRVSCPDLYDGRTAATIAEAETLSSELDADAAWSAVVAAAAELSHDGAREIAAIGFSMGGWFAVGLGARTPGVGAVVLVYGGADAPVELALETGARAFLGHFCPADEWEDIERARALFAGLAEAGRESELHEYAGAGHWFMEDDRPEAYVQSAAELAWVRTLSFLHAQLHSA